MITVVSRCVYGANAHTSFRRLGECSLLGNGKGRSEKMTRQEERGRERDSDKRYWRARHDGGCPERARGMDERSGRWHR